jgi:hypothetical protein
MVLSNHARVRMQQRGIPERIVDWLLAFAVCSDGQVTTVGHRYQRIVRH